MNQARRVALACAAALLTASTPALAGGEVYGGVPAGAGQPNDAVEAYGEAEYVNGDPYGRSDYWQDGRGNRLGTQYGPGFYQKGYYYPGERQFPDYWAYDARRNWSEGSLWSVLYKGAVDPFVPDQNEIDAVRAAPLRVITKLRIDEDLRRLHAMAKAARDDWAGGEYDHPRPLK